MAQAAGEIGVEPKALIPDVVRYLEGLDWPGNVRQLENTCRWLTVMASGNEIHFEDLPPELRDAGGEAGDMLDDWEASLRRWGGATSRDRRRRPARRRDAEVRDGPHQVRARPLPAGAARKRPGSSAGGATRSRARSGSSRSTCERSRSRSVGSRGHGDGSAPSGQQRAGHGRDDGGDAEPNVQKIETTGGIEDPAGENDRQSGHSQRGARTSRRRRASASASACTAQRACSPPR